MFKKNNRLEKLNGIGIPNKGKMNMELIHIGRASKLILNACYCGPVYLKPDSRPQEKKWMVAYHYSLYMALFGAWNKLGLRKTSDIHRIGIMSAAKNKVKATCYSCLKDLHAHQYPEYNSSAKRQSPAKESMISFAEPTDALNRPEKVKNRISMVFLNGHLIQTNIKLITNDVSNGLPNPGDVLKFFSAHLYPGEEALKFCYHHDATCWLTGNTPAQHWQPLAHKWMLCIPKSNHHNNEAYNRPV